MGKPRLVSSGPRDRPPARAARADPEPAGPVHEQVAAGPPRRMRGGGRRVQTDLGLLAFEPPAATLARLADDPVAGAGRPAVDRDARCR